MELLQFLEGGKMRPIGSDAVATAGTRLMEMTPPTNQIHSTAFFDTPLTPQIDPFTPS